MLAELSGLSEASKRRIAALLLVALSIFASAPVLAPLGEGVGHDLVFHLFRIEGMAQALHDGAFPVRMQYSQIQGMGYPTSIMYPDALLYFPALLRYAGLSTTMSYRVFVVAFNFLTLVSTYVFAKRFSRSRVTAFAVAIVWVFGTYRLVDIYLRAAVGEYCALSALPFIAYGLWCAFTRRGKASTRVAPCLWIAFGMAGVVCSHVISTVLAFFALAGLLIALAICGDRKVRGWLSVLGGAGIAVLLLLWMIVPMLSWYAGQDMWVTDPSRKTAMGVVAQRAGTLGQLLGVFPTIAGLSSEARDGIYHEMPLSVGVGALCLCACALASVAIKRPSHAGRDAEAGALKRFAAFEGKTRLSMIILLVFLAICVALCCLSFLWKERLPLMKLLENIQYPWRFLGPILFLCALVGLLALVRFATCQRLARFARTACICVCILALVEGGHSLTSVMYEETKLPDMAALEMSDQAATTVMNGEYLPAAVSVEDINERLQHMGEERDGYTISHHADGGRVFDIAFDGTLEGTSVELPLIYYEGYQIVDSASSGVALRASDAGFIELEVGEHFSGTVHIKWVEPSSWRIATVVSILALIAVVVWIAYRQKTAQRPRPRLHEERHSRGGGVRQDPRVRQSSSVHARGAQHSRGGYSGPNARRKS